MEEITAGHACLDGHHLGLISNTHNAHIIVPAGNDTGDMGAVAVIVHRIADKGIFIAVVCNRVKAQIIVYITIFVIVNTVFGDLVLIDPHIVFQVFMGIIHTGIDHGNNGICTMVIALPGRLHTAALQIPLVLHLSVAQNLGRYFFRIGNAGSRVGIVIFCDQHIRDLTHRLHDFLYISVYLRLIPDSFRQFVHLFQIGDTGIL